MGGGLERWVLYLIEAPRGGAPPPSVFALGVIGRVHAYRGSNMADEGQGLAVQRHLFSALILAMFLASSRQSFCDPAGVILATIWDSFG